MGFCLEPTDEMGEFSTEVRRESFYIRGPMCCYEAAGVGCAEISIKDIARIRASLDQVEKHLRAEDYKYARN